MIDSEVVAYVKAGKLFNNWRSELRKLLDVYFRDNSQFQDDQIYGFVSDILVAKEILDGAAKKN